MRHKIAPLGLKPWLLLPLFVLALGTAFSAYAWLRLRPAPTYEAGNNVVLITPAVADTNLAAASTPPKLTHPAKALLPGATWVPQTFNNCGPATTAMVLQYFGYNVSQEETKGFLRTNSDDKNVFAQEIVDYLQGQYGISSKIRYNGTLETLKLLIANGYYVMVESWLHPYEDIGHVTVIRGYDDEAQVLIADDSFIGVGVTYPYEAFDQGQWKPFNREYFPVYRPEHEAKIRSIIGPDWDDKAMYEKAVATARAEISQNPQDVYAQFNLGSSFYALGRYEEAAAAFAAAQSIGWPKRMLWYQIEPVQTLNELGRFNDALRLADQGLAGNESFAELHLEKARAYFGLGNLNAAKNEAQTALQLAPDFPAAQQFLAKLQ